MSKERKQYVLINGEGIYHPRMLSLSELDEANKRAAQQVGGNFSWVLYDPATMGRFLQPQSDY